MLYLVKFFQNIYLELKTKILDLVTKFGYLNKKN